MKKINFASHFAVLLIVTILCGLIYAAVQQSHRSGANDPQLQIALDLKNAIENNRPVEQWMSHDSTEISQSLSVFKTLYNKTGEPVQSTGFLNGQLPRMPKGVFDFTSNHQEDVLTWQPQHGVRMAMVVESVKSSQIGFVAVGRSLNEIEKREANLTTMVLVAWLVCGGIILLHLILTYINHKNQNK
ncbi:MAG: hypothetical protein ACHQF0_11040 [Chitinophagales bacterium]